MFWTAGAVVLGAIMGMTGVAMLIVGHRRRNDPTPKDRRDARLMLAASPLLILAAITIIERATA